MNSSWPPSRRRTGRGAQRGQKSVSLHLVAGGLCGAGRLEKRPCEEQACDFKSSQLAGDIFGAIGFQVMIGAFVTIGVAEMLLPAKRVPFRDYAFNFTYSIVNTIVASVCVVLSAIGMGFVLSRAGANVSLIDLRALGFSGSAARFSPCLR